MTRASLREYAAVQRERYQGARRRDKQRLLDELVAVTGMHRKAAIRMLRRPAGSEPARPRSGRPRHVQRTCDPHLAAASVVISGTVCDPGHPYPTASTASLRGLRCRPNGLILILDEMTPIGGVAKEGTI